MKKNLDKLIPTLFNILFFFTPLILFPKTSELFEFNKIVFIYLITTLILATWLTRMVITKKIIFRRTILDIPLLIFLISQFLSYLASIDKHTSLLGYYGRFNGGLVSSLTYSLLYWAYVSNMKPKSTRKSLYFLFTSAFLVSIYGVVQHFGVDKNLWVQDVQNRVFSTLGQPNWLATFVVALIPLSYAFSLKTKRVAWWGLSIILFIVLLYTKSRSGLLGLLVADIILWFNYFLSRRNTNNIRKKILKVFALWHLVLGVVIFLISTPWTPNLENIVLNRDSDRNIDSSVGPGGTESGEIRKIVWKGAIEVWGHYPVFGSGVETFAYSFYEFRPKEHNLVSEWDFLYNKAHNEYLNTAATTGTIGLTAYLILISASLYQISKNSKNQNFQNSKQIQNQNLKLFVSKFTLLGDSDLLSLGVFSGYFGMLITNFFGFATSTTSLLFFLFPAVAVGLNGPSAEFKVPIRESISFTQKVLLSLLLCTMLYVLFTITQYWYSDFLFAKGRNYEEEQNFQEARQALTSAISLNTNEPLYRNELAQVISQEAISLSELGRNDEAINLAQEAITESKKSIALSPRNLLLLRNLSSMLIRLSIIDINYINEAKNTMLAETEYSPTDAKLFYNLGLAYARVGQIDSAILTLEKTIFLKDNYRDARLALALLYINSGRKVEAENQLRYILEHINPDDALAQQELHELTGK